MDVRAENRGRPHQKVRFSAAPVMGRNFLTQGRPGVRVRNVRGKSGPKSLCLCCFFFPELWLWLCLCHPEFWCLYRKGVALHAFLTDSTCLARPSDSGYPPPLFLGRTPKGAHSTRGRSRHLLETPFSEPLLRTLLRTLSYCETHSRPPSQNPSENPSREPFPEPSQNPS